MDQFVKLTKLPTYTFYVGDHKFQVAALSVSHAMCAANAELWGLMAQVADPVRFAEWVDHPTISNTFVWELV